MVTRVGNDIVFDDLADPDYSRLQKLDLKLGGLAKVERILEDHFFMAPFGPTEIPGPSVDVEVVVRWLAKNRDRVVAFDPTDFPAAQDVTDRLRWFLSNGSPFDADGTGVITGLWDGGTALTTHQEFGSRIRVFDGATAQFHATHIAGTIGASRPDWLIVDHYGIDARWHRALKNRLGRDYFGKIMVIDDLADRPHNPGIYPILLP